MSNEKATDQSKSEKFVLFYGTVFGYLFGISITVVISVTISIVLYLIFVPNSD